MAATEVSPLVTHVTDKITVAVYDKSGVKTGEVVVDPAEFGGKINKQLLHDAVLMYRANQRAGTHSTLRRGEVAGSTKKLFRQKGTGNARAGTKRTNKRRGGGTAKGPKPRDYEYHLPKKALRSATRMAILGKLLDGEVVIVDDFGLTEPKTKAIQAVFKNIQIGKKSVKKLIDGAEQEVEKPVTLLDTTLLLGTAQYDPIVYKSARNIEGVEVLPASQFNAYAVLKQKRLVLTKAAFEALRTQTYPNSALARPETVTK